MEETTLDALLWHGETQSIEIKGPCTFDGDMRAHLAFSIGCMANAPGGGTIIIGVENTTWQVQELTAKQIASFDSTKIAHYLKERFDPLPQVHVERVDHHAGPVLLIAVAEFDDVPIVAVKQIASSQRTYANPGDVPMRSRTCECRRIASADEMRELLFRAVTRRTEVLLSQFRALMLGASAAPASEPPEELFAGALPNWAPDVPEWRGRHAQCAWWEVNLLPMPALDAPLDPSRVVDLIRASAVRWRGWHYPTLGVKGQNLEYFQDFARLAYEGNQESELWEAAYAGAFASAHVLRTDLIPEDPVDFRHQPPPDRLVDYVGVCWSLTEFLRFATSYAEGLGCESLWVRVALRNVQGRELSAFDSRYALLASGASSMPDIVQARIFSRAELQSAWRELAVDWTKAVLTVFQWPDASRDGLASQQTRLIERRW